VPLYFAEKNAAPSAGSYTAATSAVTAFSSCVLLMRARGTGTAGRRKNGSTKRAPSLSLLFFFALLSRTS